MKERDKKERIKRGLIEKAIETFTEIFPLTHLKILEKGFTEEANKILFWFNDNENSTHLLTAEV